MEKKNQDLKPKSLLDFNPLTPTPPNAKPQLPKCPRGEESVFSVELSLLYPRSFVFSRLKTQCFTFHSLCVRGATNTQRTDWRQRGSIIRRVLVVQRKLNECQEEFFFFLFCPLLHSLACPMFFLETPCFPQPFALVHLFL